MILEIFAEYENVAYYTVKSIIDDVPDELTETDKFYASFDDPAHPHFEEFDTIYRVVDAMGNSPRGAERCLFRFENDADALPPNRRDAERVFGIDVIKHSELRLYCIRLSNDVVVLLNGGVKIEDDPRDCPNVGRHFHFAQLIARAIDQLIAEKAIQIGKKCIINNTGEDDVTLLY